MALEKEVRCDKYEIVGRYKHIQCRTATIVKEDGVELSRSFHRHVLTPDMDVSSESDEIKGMADALWTDEVKAAWCLHSKGYPIGDPSTDWELAQLQKYCDDNSVDYEDGNNLDEDGNAISANSKAELVELIEAA
jgi:hypothetical protein